MIEGVGGTDLGGQVKIMKWVHLGLGTAKISLDHYLQLFECINIEKVKWNKGV